MMKVAIKQVCLLTMLCFLRFRGCQKCPYCVQIIHQNIGAISIRMCGQCCAKKIVPKFKTSRVQVFSFAAKMDKWCFTKRGSFTTILDFDLTLDNIRELSNSWGTVKIIIPDLEIQIVQALGRLIYCGDTENLAQEAMQEIIKYIRPAFGGHQV